MEFFNKVENDPLKIKNEFSDACRLCLEKSESFHNIFELENEFSTHFNLLFQQNVSKCDNWPQNICMVCLEKVEQFYVFYNIVKSSEKILEQEIGILVEYPKEFETIWISPDTEHEHNLKIKNEEASSISEQTQETENDIAASKTNQEKKSNEENMIKRLKVKNKYKSQKIFSNKSKLLLKESLTEAEKTELQLKKEKEDLEINKYCLMECALCQKPLDNFLNVKAHYKSEHEISGYIKCCNRKFYNRAQLLQHVTFHINPEVFTCPICNKNFRSVAALRTHKDLHIPLEKRKFKCDQCPMAFSREYQLKAHIKIHIPEEEKDFNCSQCNKKFSTIGRLTTHIRYRHENAGTHICEICAKVFKSKEIFLIHQVEHLDKKPPKVECDICKKKFQHKQGLRTHYKLHKSTNVSHQCHLCSQISASRRALTSHIRFVHTEKHFKCTLCDKEFKRPIYFKEHMAGHTGELLYKCAFCTKMFNSNANKYVHQKKKHPVEWEEWIKKKKENF